MGHKIGGRFELGELIAQGGMGAVYKGRDAQTGDAVAIKHLKSEYVYQDPSLVERFEREGSALRQLNHPNVVKMLATIEEDQHHYLVMEYVGGGSLAHRLTQEPQLPIQYTLQLALDLTDALIRAHRLKILHRDIKPSNILLDEDGTPRLSDFGVAQIGDSKITPNGTIVGTCSYLAPEVINGEAVDTRSDIWSFGVTLFEILAGRVPFQGEHITALFKAITTERTPDLQALRSDVPVALADLIYRMLEKDRTYRIGSARQIGSELEAILNNVGLPARSPTKQFTVHGEHASAFVKQPTPNNLIISSTPFVGREADLVELARLFNDPETRLITITGTGGIGKTRLALEAARMQLPNFANGVFFIDLASLTASSFILAKIAEAIRFSFYRIEEPLPQLLDYLRSKHMLLIMDNFEHLLENAKILAEIIEAAPNVKILVTSREKLNLQGEHILRLEGMELTGWNNLAEAMRSSAVKLFQQSAVRVKPDFRITENDLQHLAYICRRVAGIPLGLLLAASWVETLSLQEIAQELAGSVDFLATEMRDLPSRHRSIREVFDYSWNLLSNDERQIYAKLAIFRHGFSRDAAQIVAGASLRSLTTLVNKSLVRRNAAGRYEVHEMLRQYAEEHLNAMPALKVEVQEVHCKYYAGFTKSHEVNIRAEKEIESMAAIEEDFDNVRIAWEWAVEQGRDNEIRQMIYCLDRFMGLRSLFRQKLDLFQQAADKLEKQDAGAAKPSLRLGIVLGFLSICYGDLGDPKKGIELNDRALSILRQHDAPRELATVLLLRNWIVSEVTQRIKYLEESLAIFRTINDTMWLSSALYNLSMVLSWTGTDDERSRKLFDEAVIIAKRIGDRQAIASQAYDQGNRAASEGKYLEAKRYYEEGLVVNQQLNSKQGVANFLERLAQVALLCNEFGDAQRGYQEALDINRELGIQSGVGSSMMDLSMVAYVQGNYEEAKRLCTEALPILRETKTMMFIAMCLNRLARIESALENYSVAKQHIRESLIIALENNIFVIMVEILAVWGDILSREGEPEKAVEILSFTLHAPNDWMESRYLAARQLEGLKKVLPPKAFSAAQARGKLLQMNMLLEELGAVYSQK